MVVHRRSSHDSRKNMLVHHRVNTLANVLESMGRLHSSTRGMLSICAYMRFTKRSRHTYMRFTKKSRQIKTYFNQLEISTMCNNMNQF